MKLLLIGATGMIGSRIAAEARARGHEVTGTTRGGTDGTEKLTASDAGAVAALAAGQDAVVLAISPPRDGSDPSAPVLEAGRAVMDGMRRAGVRRLVVVGGAGSLLTEDGVRHVDEPGFPEIYKPESLSHVALLEVIRAEAGDLDWTYVSPASLIEPGERTGTFRVGGDRMMKDADGNSRISAEDYAIALVDELEKGEAIRRRISVAY